MYPSAEEAIHKIDLVNAVSVVEHKVTISATNGSQVIPSILTVFDKFQIPIISISIRSPSLEDIFIYLTGKGLTVAMGTGTIHPAQAGDSPHDAGRAPLPSSNGTSRSS